LDKSLEKPLEESRPLDCFGIQSHLSEFLDEKLKSELADAVDGHLIHCKQCTQRNLHYTNLIEAIRSLPKHPMPQTLKKPFLFFGLPWFSKWEHLPWYIRIVAETSGIIAITLIGISLVPKIRSFYEQKIESQLRDFRESASGTGEGKLTPTLSRDALVILPAQDSGDSIDGEDEDTEGKAPPKSGDDEEDVEANAKPFQGLALARQTELWRFTLKTVSPDELRAQVAKIIQSLKIQNVHAENGIQVPGGIEFDLLVAKGVVPQLKEQLEKLASQASNTTEPNLGTTDTFSWYKVKYRQKLPEGYVKAVIWLAQPNY